MTDIVKTEPSEISSSILDQLLQTQENLSLKPTDSSNEYTQTFPGRPALQGLPVVNVGDTSQGWLTQVRIEDTTYSRNFFIETEDEDGEKDLTEIKVTRLFGVPLMLESKAQLKDDLQDGEAFPKTLCATKGYAINGPAGKQVVAGLPQNKHSWVNQVVFVGDPEKRKDPNFIDTPHKQLKSLSRGDKGIAPLGSRGKTCVECIMAGENKTPGGNYCSVRGFLTFFVTHVAVETAKKITVYDLAEGKVRVNTDEELIQIGEQADIEVKGKVFEPQMLLFNMTNKALKGKMPFKGPVEVWSLRNALGEGYAPDKAPEGSWPKSETFKLSGGKLSPGMLQCEVVHAPIKPSKDGVGVERYYPDFRLFGPDLMDAKSPGSFINPGFKNSTSKAGSSNAKPLYEYDMSTVMSARKTLQDMLQENMQEIHDWEVYESDCNSYLERLAKRKEELVPTDAEGADLLVGQSMKSASVGTDVDDVIDLGGSEEDDFFDEFEEDDF